MLIACNNSKTKDEGINFCGTTLKSNEDTEKLIKNNEPIDNVTIEYFPRIRYQKLGKSGRICYNSFDELIRSSWNSLTKDSLEFFLKPVSAIQLQMSGGSPLSYYRKGIWISFIVNAKGLISEIKIKEEKLMEEYQNEINESVSKLEQTHWLPGLFEYKKVSVRLNYLLIIK